jgi:hypothetical protein
MLKLRSIGIHDYSVFEGEQRIGRIRFARERVPGIWIWNVIVPLTGGLPIGSAKDLDTAKAEFGGAWTALKEPRLRSRGSLQGIEPLGTTAEGRAPAMMLRNSHAEANDGRDHLPESGRHEPRDRGSHRV